MQWLVGMLKNEACSIRLKLNVLSLLNELCSGKVTTQKEVFATSLTFEKKSLGIGDVRTADYLSKPAEKTSVCEDDRLFAFDSK